jgi:hypothetical protein
MTSTQTPNTTSASEFAVKVRCGGRTYTESVYTYDTETAWGHQIRIERQYEIDYGYKARVVSIRKVA